MNNYLIIGIVAGLCTALLNLSGYAGGMVGLGIILVVISPLPLMIASLGWGSFTGLIAVASAGVTLAVILGPIAGLLFLILNCIPPWWLARLAALSRQNDGSETLEWYPTERILGWIVGIAALTSLAMFIPFGFSLEKYQDAIAALMKQIYEAQQGSLPGAASLTLQDVVTIVSWLAPTASAITVVYSSVLNLYLAGKITQKSGHLSRPWPDLHQVRVPVTAVFLFTVSLGAFFLLDGLPGIIAQILTSSLGAALLLVGLSVLHFMTRSSPARTFILWTAYLLLFFMQWIGVLLVILGAGDVLFNIRARMSAKPNRLPDNSDGQS
ncbi:DUF2232 domain-containing protein [uncultured Cohaesibacter sp.]|uniref:DUF2232 domain-containing protein n=1 Tax=uncultured Cohaesibacter sp. TaxID=1002546 RepID=UPI00292F4B29|nr:DUF2232 domain-containing protein [uncultured Cohaesibacter sp.]